MLCRRTFSTRSRQGHVSHSSSAVAAGIVDAMAKDVLRSRSSDRESLAGYNARRDVRNVDSWDLSVEGIKGAISQIHAQVRCGIGPMSKGVVL